MRNMLFGTKEQFGIEIGDVQSLQGGVYCQFRFWISGKAIGDWEDRIPLFASVVNMRRFCEHLKERIDPRFAGDANVVFRDVYEAFYSADYTACDPDVANLRDRFHLEDVGMGAIVDKYGIVVVSPSAKESRIIVKDWTRNGSIWECSLPFGDVERIGWEYVDWANQVLIE